MTLPKGITRDTVELQTAELPYGITINYIMTDSAGIKVNGAISGDAFQRNAIVLFSLIDNADVINCKIADKTAKNDGTIYTFTYTREAVALKKMLRNLSPLKAAVLLGVIWSFWHLPLFFIKGTTQNALTSFGIIPAILGYFLYTVMISVLITLLYVMSNGSVFGSMLLHTVENLSLGVVPLIFSKNGAAIVLLTLCITVTVILYKYKKIMFHKA